jgi:peptidoglycan L-alanyl-D-glutamate endopeptidase CwlK
MDKITEQRIGELHPKIRQQVTQLFLQAEKALTGHATLRIVQGLRTIQEQDALFAKGRTAPGPKVTNARGGQSYHNFGLAFDIALLIDGKTISWDTAKDYDNDNVADWMEFVKLAEAAGFEWGGHFKSIIDKPHFQMTFGFTVKQLFQKYTSKQVDINGYVNI